jgi:deoxycytidylate deaminase
MTEDTYDSLRQQFQPRIDAIDREARQATSPIYARQNAEIKALEAEMDERRRAIYMRYFPEIEAANKPFIDQIRPLRAEWDARLSVLRRGENAPRRRCIHGGTFPCHQCVANRRTGAAAGFPIDDQQFEKQYAGAEF